MSCTGNTQWYVCSKGDFKGCCSSDPCGTGICPDSQGDDGSDSGSGSSKPLTSSTSTTTTTPEHRAMVATTSTTASRSFDTSSSMLSSTQMMTVSPETAAATGGSMMDMNGDSGSMHDYHEGLIGGVITGCVVAVLLLLGILLWVWYRSRKKRGKGFALLEWYGARYGRQRNGHSVSGGGHIRNRRRGGHTNTSPCTCCKPSVSTGKVNTNTNTPVSNSNVNIGRTTPSSATRLLAHTPPSAISSPGRQFQPYQRAAPLETIPSPTLLYRQKKEKGRRQRTTPELGDTGFYRPRVELATHPQSELINVPPGERTRRHYHSPRLSPSPKPSPNHGHGHGQGGAQPARHIVTPDGAILAANFEHSSPGAHEHVTSFADVPLGLGIDFAYAGRDIMRRADAVAEDHGQDADVLPAYSGPLNKGSRNDHTNVNKG